MTDQDISKDKAIPKATVEVFDSKDVGPLSVSHNENPGVYVPGVIGRRGGPDLRLNPKVDLTYGQQAVGMSFNPSASSEVDQVKEAFAQIIDQLDQLRNRTGSHEVRRLASVAITEAQGAQMWACKAITWKD